MATCTKEQIFYIFIGFWLVLGVECYSGVSSHVLTVKPGGSVTIPCHYDEKNPPQEKYWYSETDQSKTYTNTTEENLSVIDHPDQSLFTVTMRNLKGNQIGQYYCAVETKGNSSVTYEPYLQVQADPDVSVMNSSVSGHEGDDVSVQCFYSSGYQNKVKKWCRYKDQRCYEVGRTDTSQNSSVQISDDGRNFTVLMTGLRLSDSGWYFCSDGNQEVPVHLTVTEAEPVNRIKDIQKSGTNETGSNNNNNNTKAGDFGLNANKGLLTVWLPVSAALLLLLILVGVFTWRKLRHNQDKLQDRERNNSNTFNPNPNEDTTYSTITDASGSEANPPADDIVYSTVAPH